MTWTANGNASGREVDLFIPCLVDRFLPDVGLATAHCLRTAGCEVRYDPNQTCCGQIFINSGSPRNAAPLARAFVRRFADAQAVVSPSWSCVSTVRDHYREVLDDPGLVREWEALRPRVHELCDFLIRECGVTQWPGRFEVDDAELTQTVFHWSCHMPHDKASRLAVETLLGGVEGVSLLPMPKDECCGFGGVFMAMWREVSAAIARRRLASLTRFNPDILVLGEPGCILQLRSVAPNGLRVLHVAQLLAGCVSNT